MRDKKGTRKIFISSTLGMFTSCNTLNSNIADVIFSLKRNIFKLKYGVIEGFLGNACWKPTNSGSLAEGLRNGRNIFPDNLGVEHTEITIIQRKNKNRKASWVRNVVTNVFGHV